MSDEQQIILGLVGIFVVGIALVAFGISMLLISSDSWNATENWCRHAHKDVASYEQCLEKPDFPWKEKE
jgi:hypothetical protein